MSARKAPGGLILSRQIPARTYRMESTMSRIAGSRSITSVVLSKKPSAPPRKARRPCLQLPATSITLGQTARGRRLHGVFDPQFSEAYFTSVSRTPSVPSLRLAPWVVLWSSMTTPF